MNDRDALTAAVHADPADDTPRLAFADWLDEHGSVTVDCPACAGTGLRPKKRPLEPDRDYTCAQCGEPSGMYGHWHRGKWNCEPPECPRCRGKKVVTDDDNAARAELIRLQIARARDPSAWNAVREEELFKGGDGCRAYKWADPPPLPRDVAWWHYDVLEPKPLRDTMSEWLPDLGRCGFGFVRGFVGLAVLPTSVFTARFGRCVACNATGRRPGPTGAAGYVECELCDGDGWHRQDMAAPAFAGLVWERWPTLEEIRLSDRRPRLMQGGYAWYRGRRYSRDEDTYRVPEPLFYLMWARWGALCGHPRVPAGPPAEPKTPGNDPYLAFPASVPFGEIPDAATALSDACLEFAKRASRS